jgi:hypothetical protein
VANEIARSLTWKMRARTSPHEEADLFVGDAAFGYRK